MKTTSQPSQRQRFHADAYRYVFDALRHTQQKLGRVATSEHDEAEAHISGPELMWGLRELAQQQFGMLAHVVFQQWGVRSTGDFGRIVFELVDRGEMKKTDRDSLHDFYDVYDFDDAFDREYEIDISPAFAREGSGRYHTQTG